MARKSKRSYDVHRFPTTTPNKFIEVSVAYCEGGAEAFSGRTNARAYYMHVTPVGIEDRGNGVEIKSFMLFRGYKSKLEEVKRFSDKKLAQWVEQIQRDCETKAANVMNLVDRVVAEESLTLVEPVSA